MSRVRLAFLLLVPCLAIPVLLLVWRALESVELERRVRNEAVAERVFDEMERALTRFLEQEEERPAEDYRFYSWLDDDPQLAPLTRVRSPLSWPPEQAFVIGHFQLDPDGRFRTPLEPDDELRARRLGDWPLAPALREASERAIAELHARAEPFWREALARRRLKVSARGAAEAPRTTAEAPRSADESGGRTQSDWGKLLRAPVLRMLEEEQPLAGRAAPEKDVRTEQAPLPSAAAPADAAAESQPQAEQKSSAYDILQSLNIGARQRQVRKQKVTEAKRSPAFAMRSAEPSAPEPAEERVAPAPAPQATAEAEIAKSGTASAAGEGLELDRSGSAYAPLGQSEGAGAYGSLDADARADDESALRKQEASILPASASPARRNDRVRIILEPMTGQPLDDDHLILYRTVLVDGRGYRQGLLIDRQRLASWLGEQVLADSALAASLRLGFDEVAGSSPVANDHYLASHDFAEPFRGLHARLEIPPLSDLGSGGLILALAGLLGVVALAGLAALYRMVSVVVHFAERRNNFVAAVSHELKTPLTAIRMYGEMLRDGMVGSEAKRDEYYQTISDESERLSRLIDNVLEFSRLEKGKRELTLSVGSLGDVVRDVADKLRPHAEREGFRLQVEVEEALPAVRFDRDALVQMLFNLVDNAMKYGGRAECREIRLRCAELEGGRVGVSVRDFGPGVPRQHVARVFEPFFRAEQELTRSTKGSGIGLALVKELGEAMGAVVSGSNAEGGGFRVSIAFEA